ncbi:MAG: T9SS type A sorting domain-containing protein [Bacteroidota bacterium]|nr:T9SS type A sorting domain-containing protein [Bacteroidota bacterium]
MKNKIFLLILSLFCLPFGINAQRERLPQPPDWNILMLADNANYFDIKNQVIAHFDLYPPSEIEYGEETEGDRLSHTQFMRWSDFWESRVGTTNVETNGKFSNLFNAYSSYAASPVCNSTGPYPSSWQLLGPTNAPNQTMGLISAVEKHPTNSNIIYAGSNNSGIWKTVDGGLNWVSKTDYLKYPGMGITDILIDPISPNTVYISTGSRSGYGVGVLKSTDGGNTWNTTGLTYTPSQGITTQRLRVDPTNTNIVYAITDYDVWRSTNGGTSWTSIHTVSPSCWIPLKLADIEILPGNSNVVFVSEIDWNTCNSGARIWKLELNGMAWNVTNITPAIVNSGYLVERFEMDISPATPDMLYVVYNEVNISLLSSQTYISNYTNATSTWSLPMVNPIQIGFFDYQFEVSPTDPNVMYMGNALTYKTTNAGVNWSLISYYNAPTTHADIRAIHIASGSIGGGSDIVYLGTDGGVSKSVNGGSTWSNINGNGLAITQFYGIGNSDLAPDVFAGGTQDNGVITNTNGAWQTVIVGDAYDCEIDQVDPNYMYLCVNGGGNTLNRSTNAGISWSWFPQPPGTSRTTRPIEINDTDKKLYVGYHDVWECANPRAPSPTWTQLSNFVAVPAGYALRCVMPAPNNPNVIYASYSRQVWGGNYSNIFFKTTNHGATWTDIAPNTGLGYLAWGTISHIEVDPYNSNRLWITWDGVDAGNRVCYSGDGGTTWSDYSTGLPGIPMNDLVYERGTNDGLYIATDVGVFYRNATMLQWECFSYQLPCVTVSDLEINYGKNVLRAATYGRGIWESSLACPQNYTLTLTGATNTNTFQEAQIYIASSQQITGGNVLYRGGHYVELNPGFSASTNGYFSAYIHACDIIGNSNLTTREQQSPDVEMSQTTSSSKTTVPEDLEVFPNPNDGHFTVMMEGVQFNIEIYTVLGEMIYTEKDINETRYEVDLSTYPKGVYIIKCSDGKTAKVDKVICR